MRGHELLDLARGTGKSFEPLMRRGFRVTACDASPGMLAEASIRAPEATLKRTPRAREHGTWSRVNAKPRGRPIRPGRRSVRGRTYVR